MSKRKTESYRNVSKNRFTQVGNGMAWDSELSLEGKGLMLIFLSNKDDWELNMKEIIKRSKNGRDAHYRVVNELIDKGYFARVEFHDENNKFEGIEYFFSDNKEDVQEALAEYRDQPNVYINLDKRKKKTKEKTPITESQETGETGFTENQETENQKTETQDNNNTNHNNTNLNNTKSNKDQSVYQDRYNKISNTISDMYKEKALPIPILKQMDIYKDRLTDDNINPYEILAFYEMVTEHDLDDSSFAYRLGRVLKHTKGKIKDIHAVMKKASENHFEEYEG